MKITVFGQGAIGSLIGGLLHLKNHNVSFVTDPQSDDPRENRYLRIVLPDRWLKIDRIAHNPVEKCEIALFALKRTQYPDISIDDIRRHTGNDSLEIVYCNVNTDDIGHLDQDAIESSIALTLLTSVMLQKDDVELTSTNSYIVFRKSKTLRKLFAPLSEYGIRSLGVDDPRPYANSFFIYQLLSLPAAMCNATVDFFLSFKEGRELAVRVLNEGFKSFTKLQIPLARLPVMDPVDLLARLEKKPEKFDACRFREDRSYNTVLQSFLRGDKHELARLNAKLITVAKDAGVDPLWNWKLMQKVPRVIKYGFFPNPKELMDGLD